MARDAISVQLRSLAPYPKFGPIKQAMLLHAPQFDKLSNKIRVRIRWEKVGRHPQLPCLSYCNLA